MDGCCQKIGPVLNTTLHKFFFLSDIERMKISIFTFNLVGFGSAMKYHMLLIFLLTQGYLCICNTYFFSIESDGRLFFYTAHYIILSIFF